MCAGYGARGHRRGPQVALSVGAAELEGSGCLLEGLDPFDDHDFAEFDGQFGDRMHHSIPGSGS